MATVILSGLQTQRPLLKLRSSKTAKGSKCSKSGAQILCSDTLLITDNPFSADFGPHWAQGLVFRRYPVVCPLNRVDLCGVTTKERWSPQHLVHCGICISTHIHDYFSLALIVTMSLTLSPTHP